MLTLPHPYFLLVSTTCNTIRVGQIIACVVCHLLCRSQIIDHNWRHAVAIVEVGIHTPGLKMEVCTQHRILRQGSPGLL